MEHEAHHYQSNWNDPEEDCEEFRIIANPRKEGNYPGNSITKIGYNTEERIEKTFCHLISCNACYESTTINRNYNYNNNNLTIAFKDTQTHTKAYTEICAGTYMNINTRTQTHTNTNAHIPK